MDTEPLKCPNETCGLCGAKFRCEVAAGQGSCWCFQFPPLNSRLESNNCVCPSCLSEASRAQVAEGRGCTSGTPIPRA
ncbi:MAG: cysteine-rich CWC family protein [Verrucomicrobiota bacterium]|nr:cysteine-rich CWC family protein [Verrucomicrobiota bacterium]